MPIRNVKLSFLGDSGVGKSSMVFRITLEHFTGSVDATVGATFLTKSICVDGVTYKFQIWDTAGQERFRSLAPSYIHGAAAIVVVYDVTNKDSFTSVTDYWWKKIQKHGSSNLVVAVAGNKCDLGDQRAVKIAEGRLFAENMEAIFFETSAVTSTNLTDLLIQIAKKLPPGVDDESIINLGRTSSKNNNNKVKKSDCCSLL